VDAQDERDRDERSDGQRGIALASSASREGMVTTRAADGRW
jgi:hypothetical protein